MTTWLLYALVISLISIVSCAPKLDLPEREDVGKTASIQRQVTTPSGDWGGKIEYTYGKNGKLRHISYDFSTFTGYDKRSGDFKSTRCVREYEVTDAGKLVLKSKQTSDLTTGNPVERTFYDPEFSHWMTLAEAQQGIKEEKSRRSDEDNP